MIYHRNSQKRYYIPEEMYFITMNTRDRQPYFVEDILCQLFVDEIEICRAIKQCGMIAYKLNPDHVHMIIQPSSKANYSEVIRSLRTNFSRNTNRVMDRSNDNMDSEHIISIAREKSRQNQYVFGNEFSEIISRHSEQLCAYRNQFRKKYHVLRFMPVFRWHLRFHDHIIRNQKDLENHIRYLRIQWIKHGLRENKWLWIHEDYMNLGNTNKMNDEDFKAIERRTDE